MKTPRWLSDELDEAVKKAASKQLSKSDAMEDLAAAVLEKDEEYVLALIKDKLSGQFDQRMQNRLRLAVREMEREADDEAGASRQLGFDDVCSYFFPEDTFPPSTLLTEAAAWAYDLLGRAERHYKVAGERVKFTEQMLTAVGGNADGKATLGEAVAALRDSGSAAAEG